MGDMPASSIDAIVTDPPYGLEFMGKEWDCLDNGKGESLAKLARTKPGNLGGFATGDKPSFARTLRYLPRMQQWHYQWSVAALRVLKPGGYMLCFGGSRTYHRLACAVEDAGFEIRDCIMWIYGSGFPKGKGCLKPAYEPILLCRKPGGKVLPLGIEECRVGTANTQSKASKTALGVMNDDSWQPREVMAGSKSGRWPANIVHDGSEEVMERFAEFGKTTSGAMKKSVEAYQGESVTGFLRGRSGPQNQHGDTGTAARFFYCAKASRKERGEGNDHPTVKPLALMEWLIKMVCPPGGIILDPFAGSGTTLLAARNVGRLAIGIEKNKSYRHIAKKRLQAA
jgi:site-specific DNA-methyltransferase (adenine-specific)